ncbi:reverse transcriptase domain-containing protein [Tanacetum coccineum]
MTHLLEKETPFIFSKECIEAFETHKMKLTQALILVSPDWDLPCEIMCNASDFAVGAVLGKRKTKHLGWLPFVVIMPHGLPFWKLPCGEFCDQRDVVSAEKKVFQRGPFSFGDPRAIISDRGTYFCNDQFAKVMLKYGVTHRLSTAYHPQTSGQVEDFPDCEDSHARGFALHP